MQIDEVRQDGRLLSIIIRPGRPEETRFLTPPDFNLQAGFVVRRSGESVDRHVHLPVERHVVGTTEVLMLSEGRARLEVFDDDRNLVTTRELEAGDVCITVAGGHGFVMLEDTVMFEVKQGPYSGVDADKARF